MTPNAPGRRGGAGRPDGLELRRLRHGPGEARLLLLLHAGAHTPVPHPVTGRLR
jgi:hypothetical protein